MPANADASTSPRLDVQSKSKTVSVRRIGGEQFVVTSKDAADNGARTTTFRSGTHESSVADHVADLVPSIGDCSIATNLGTQPLTMPCAEVGDRIRRMVGYFRDTPKLRENEDTDLWSHF